LIVRYLSDRTVHEENYLVGFLVRVSRGEGRGGEGRGVGERE
jgi:hypothetical protein